MVWAAQTALGELVAVKVMMALAVDAPMVRARFSRQALVGRRLHGPHFARVIASGIDEGRAYLATELFVGEDLEERLFREGHLPVAEVSALVAQLGEGLAQIHEKGIIHRKLEPSNLYFDRSPIGVETLKILDFGFACAGHSHVRLTAPGVAVGSRHYRSPEQASNEPLVDARSDLFSVGAVAYHCLVGRRPFDGGPSRPNVVREQPPAPSRVRPELGRGFDLFFARALAREPSARFHSALDLVEKFAVAARQTSGTRPAVRPTPVEHRPPARTELPTIVAEEDYEGFAARATSVGPRVRGSR